MSTPDPNKKPRRTTMLLPDVGQTAKRASHNALLRLFRHLLSKPIARTSELPSDAERKIAVSGFVSGVVSIFTSILPICGLLAAICGLSIGIYSRRKSRALYPLASWAIGLSLTGLVLSLLITVITHI